MRESLSSLQKVLPLLRRVDGFATMPWDYMTRGSLMPKNQQCASGFVPEWQAMCHDALLIHGHIGYIDEYPIERRLRDVLGLELGAGTAEIMKVIISRQILGREFAPEVICALPREL